LLSLARHSIGIVFQGLVFNGMAVQVMGKQRTGMGRLYTAGQRHGSDRRAKHGQSADLSARVLL